MAASRTLVIKVISGGQTGADRGGQEAGLLLRLPIGGTAPMGWRSDDGVIPVRYRAHMTESLSKEYQPRTWANVRDSSGTLIFTKGGDGGTTPGCLLTVRCCREQGRRFLMVPMTLGKPGNAAEWIKKWLREREDPAFVLNVAGSRESKAPGIFDYTVAALRAALAAVNSHELDS